MDSRVRRRPLIVAWREFWFQDIPPHLYAALRILIGLVGLVGVLAIMPVSMLWLPDGISPVPGQGLGVRAWVIDHGLGSVAGWGLFVLLGVSFTSMTFGFLSAFSIALAFAGTFAQAMWNPLPLSGAHHVLACVLFYLLWADCSRVWSVDARLGTVGAPWTTATIWPLRLVRLQVAVIYLNSGISKLMLPEWQNGTAVYYSLKSNVFQRFPGGIPAGMEAFATFATYATLFFELGFAFMVLSRRSRKLALAAGVAMHLGIALTMELGTFSWVMLASYCAFLEPDEFTRLMNRWRGKELPALTG